MEKLFDKIIILICCCVFYFSDVLNTYAAIPIIIVIILGAFIHYFDKDFFYISGYLLFTIICWFFPIFIYFLPLMCYHIFCEPYKYAGIVIIAPLFKNFWNFDIVTFFWLSILLLFVFSLKLRTAELLNAKLSYIKLRDDMMEYASSLDYKNKELLEKQDYEINNATLNERNRISREIHDNVGHIISRSILQMGALMAIAKDKDMKEQLKNINDTLSSGMDSIRASIHNIHEDSMDLQVKLNDLIENFTFCTVNFTYNISTDFPMKAKYSILYIIKEALSNIMKHSNATEVDIIITELPALYQIIIRDNGTKAAKRSGSGMGITSISERVSNLSGNINITKNDGYRMFISIPKK